MVEEKKAKQSKIQQFNLVIVDGNITANSNNITLEEVSAALISLAFTAGSQTATQQKEND